MKNLAPAMFVIFAAVSAPAQVQRNFRASITGGGGDGKCTIEVDVDDVAMVEISGAQGRLITMSGQPAEWRRMQCNQPMPADPYDFRFTGIDGRGRVALVRDPRQNRGVAVIRIEVTGEAVKVIPLIWSGGAGARIADPPAVMIDVITIDVVTMTVASGMPPEKAEGSAEAGAATPLS